MAKSGGGGGRVDDGSGPFSTAKAMAKPKLRWTSRWQCMIHTPVPITREREGAKMLARALLSLLESSNLVVRVLSVTTANHKIKLLPTPKSFVLNSG